MVEVIVIVLMFGHLFAIVWLIDCLVKRPIAFSFTKPLVLVIDSLGFWSFDCFWS